MPSQVAEHRRLVIVSNRLPFTVHIESSDIQFQSSAGGLVTGLSSFLESLASPSPLAIDNYLWVGWPGTTVEDHLKQEVTNRAMSQHRALPVFLQESEMDDFYHGFCNKTIWPLFHYFPTYTIYQQDFWDQYQHVNELFCDSLVKELKENDVVWIHDYHLMLLPKLLKSRMPNIPVGFFLHTPFPSFEVYRLLPEHWRAEILDGMLGADLIGFHTYEYSQHFLQSVLRILGYEHQMGLVSLPSRVVKVETFPMGIDFERYAAAGNSSSVVTERENIKPSLMGFHVILSVDRLDYSKGILNRLQGFELLLEQYPEFIGKVVLVMVVVPSRIRVDQYEQMKRQIEESVGKINGAFGSLNWTPIIYQYRQLSFESLVALYTLSDAALVTPLRDGMNLIAKEYVASRSDMLGVLILSEMAGAAQELRESIIVNPNNRQAIADAMSEALRMPPDEQRRRNQVMQNRLRRYNVRRWANDFMMQLSNTQEVQKTLNAKLVQEPIRRQIIGQYAKSTCRLLLLDYDGTLSPLVRRPETALPSTDVLGLLQKLACTTNNDLVLISGRGKNVSEQWFGNLGINIIAEHGAWIKERNQDWKTSRQLTSGWKAQIIPILELYADRLPGALVEEKDFSIAWHYRNADPEQSSVLARQLSDHLTTFTANIDIQILHGNKVIEVRNTGINKGTAALYWLNNKKYDFVLAVGDDWTDEDLFNVLPPSAHSIRVGMTATRANYNLHNSDQVIRLLHELERLPETGTV